MKWFNASSEVDALCSALMCDTKILILCADSQRSIYLTLSQTSCFQFFDLVLAKTLTNQISHFCLLVSLSIPFPLPTISAFQMHHTLQCLKFCPVEDFPHDVLSGLPLKDELVQRYFIFCLHSLTKLTHLWIKLAYFLSHQLVIENDHVTKVWIETKAPEKHGLWASCSCTFFVPSGPAWAWFWVYHTHLLITAARTAQCDDLVSLKLFNSWWGVLAIQSFNSQGQMCSPF